MDDETQEFLKICDSSDLHSRKTLKYNYNPEKDILGQGGFGLVYKVHIEKEIPGDVRTYAIKIFSKKLLKEDQEKASIVLNEIRIHRSLRHEHICKYEHCFEDTDNVYILMEYCPNGTLLDLLKSRKKLEEIEIRFYMFQVLKVLKYFRIQKIVHRDLTLKNIFLKDNKNIKISDFGLAYNEYEYDEKSGLICGTPGYFTPESKLCKYSYKTDIFCFGMCIYYLFGGSTKFITSQQSYEFFSNNLFEPENKIKLSEEALDLIKKLVAIEGKRIGLEQIYIHPFFNKGIGLEKKNFPDYNDKDYMEKIKELNIKFGIKPIERNIKQNLDNSNLNNNINNGINFRGSFKEILDPKIQEKNNIISDSSEEEDESSKLKNYFNNRKQNNININQIIYIVNLYDKLMENCGVGYKLNNNNIGFIFNDNSQLTKINKEENYLFYHKNNGMNKNDENILINLKIKSQIPKEILKKIKLLEQIEEKFKNKEKTYIRNKNFINNINQDIYVKKYKKGHRCLVLLFSNKNIQVTFVDGNIIFFNYFPKALIYFSNEKASEINIFPLQKDENFSNVNCDNYFINNKIKSALEELK